MRGSFMYLDSKEYFLRSITDLCSSGSNKKYIEFRLTEVKASMRFWWRAFNYYDNPQKLWNDERKIFGDGDNIKSPIEFRLLQGNWKFKEGQDSHVVSKYYDNKMDKNGEKIKKQRTIPCTSSGKEIAFKMSLYERRFSKENFTDKNINFYDSLLKLSFILGGIGKRSRRGCGAFYISDKHSSSHGATSGNIYSDIKRLMENIGIDSYYDFSNNNSLLISRKKFNPNLEYPYLEEINISNAVISENNFYENKIKRAIDECEKNNITYKASDGRFACPVYVTCYGSNKDRIIPIIVRLHNTSRKSGENYDDTDYYNKFKEMIL